MVDNKKLYFTIGRLIRDARETAGLKQEDLSIQLGLTRTSVSNFERGRQHVQLHTLYQIAQILNVPIVDLIPSEKLVFVVSTTQSPKTEALVRQLLNEGKPGES